METRPATMLLALVSGLALMANAAVEPPVLKASGPAVSGRQVHEVGKPVLTQTTDNLQTAYNGECNAKARYDAFAKKADEEGCKAAAKLFRAAAKAEEVHALRHATAIRSLNVEPKSVVEIPEAKTTKENLAAALAGELKESTEMYPEFVKQAAADKNAQARRSFRGALATEVEHARMFQLANDNFEAWKKETKTFYVCLKCGYTMMDTPPSICPICAIPRRDFQVVQ